RPVVVGTTRNGRHDVVVLGSGLWRWASHGGLAEQAYRSLTAAMTDWLLEERSQASADLTALRDSLARRAAPILPRPRTLAPQPGQETAAAGESVPVRFSPWLYLAALAALLVEWVARRRRGLR